HARDAPDEKAVATKGPENALRSRRMNARSIAVFRRRPHRMSDAPAPLPWRRVAVPREVHVGMSRGAASVEACSRVSFRLQKATRRSPHSRHAFTPQIRDDGRRALGNARRATDATRSTTVFLARIISTERQFDAAR